MFYFARIDFIHFNLLFLITIPLKVIQIMANSQLWFLERKSWEKGNVKVGILEWVDLDSYTKGVPNLSKNNQGCIYLVSAIAKMREPELIQWVKNCHSLIQNTWPLCNLLTSCLPLSMLVNLFQLETDRGNKQIS